MFRVRSAALAVSRRNCPPADFQRSLESLLARETDPELLLFLLEQVSGEAGRNAWRYDELIRLTQSGRIPADKAFGLLCSATVSGEKPDAAVLDVPFWWNVFETHESRRACLVQNLFLRLDQERQLSQLRRLFTEAAGHRYGFGSTQGLYGPASPRPSSYWDSIPAAADQMLALFKAHLGPRAMRAWDEAPETPLGARLLLGRWLGNDPAGLLPRDAAAADRGALPDRRRLRGGAGRPARPALSIRPSAARSRVPGSGLHGGRSFSTQSACASGSATSSWGSSLPERASPR